MKVYLANLGVKNIHWPICLSENLLTLETSRELYDFWTKNDKDTWIKWAIKNETMSNGQPAIPSVASRWFNLLNIFHETDGDLWVHREKTDLYWTISQAGEVTRIETPDPYGEKRDFYLLKKKSAPWRNRDKLGRSLQWSALHPKSHHFLATEATYQEVASDRGYKEYAIALIDGDPLEAWHSQLEWKTTAGKKGSVRRFSNLEMTILNAIYTINGTVTRADGRVEERVTKEKNLLVTNEELNVFLNDLYREQEGLCALTGLPMLLIGDEGSQDFLLSVDRINSDGHYEPNNLQLVCRFANFWKQASDDKRFKELITSVRTESY